MLQASRSCHSTLHWQAVVRETGSPGPGRGGWHGIQAPSDVYLTVCLHQTHQTGCPEYSQAIHQLTCGSGSSTIVGMAHHPWCGCVAHHPWCVCVAHHPWCVCVAHHPWCVCVAHHPLCGCVAHHPWCGCVAHHPWCGCVAHHPWCGCVAHYPWCGCVAHQARQKCGCGANLVGRRRECWLLESGRSELVQTPPLPTALQLAGIAVEQRAGFQHLGSKGVKQLRRETE